MRAAPQKGRLVPEPENPKPEADFADLKAYTRETA